MVPGGPLAAPAEADTVSIAGSESSGYPSTGDWDEVPDKGMGFDGSSGQPLAMSQRRAKQLPSIFIHAGAGFHSYHNERIHLEACSDAALMGMKFLRNGASATEAVEAALKVLEDREMTNAGYGSNLSIDGTVECDATIVDHLGRSGACGAVSNIRNPISLAKLILDKSKIPLSLRRVPPNILVGDGARAFAKEHGIDILPNDALVSRNARDRYLRWQAELGRADAQTMTKPVTFPKKLYQPAPVSPRALVLPAVAAAADESAYEGSSRQRDHLNAISTSTWNEGQPDSPHQGSPAIGSTPAVDELAASSRGTPLHPRKFRAAPLPYERGGPRTLNDRASSPKRTKHMRAPDTSVKTPLIDFTFSPTESRDGAESYRPSVNIRTESPAMHAATNTTDLKSPRGTKRPFSPDEFRDQNKANGDERHAPHKSDELKSDTPPKDKGNRDEDRIDDTVGAIAIDNNGFIAAASSSGGIGMKHRGRVGPAALVGIGTSVLPCYWATGNHNGEIISPGVSVAAVTSGTGEHMATTMASRRCAERIFSNTRMGHGGFDVQEPNEDVIMESFICDDFMSHPGVKNCSSIGAIGVMVVKRMPQATYLHFAHNTDSFALASMGGMDSEPLCVMSRLNSKAKVARGARRVSHAS